VRRAALERRRHAVRKVADASVRSRAEHAARLMASAFGVGPDRRTMAPPGGLVVALDGGPVKMFSLYEPTTAAGVKDGAVCHVLSDHSGRLGALRHLGVCDRTFVGLVVFPDPRSIAEAQEYNSHFDFLVHLDGETKCAVASYGWSGLVEYALE
jgi:hypothetical protein